jgi:hypothetical protein
MGAVTGGALVGAAWIGAVGTVGATLCGGTTADETALVTMCVIGPTIDDAAACGVAAAGGAVVAALDAFALVAPLVTVLGALLVLGAAADLADTAKTYVGVEAWVAAGLLTAGVGAVVAFVAAAAVGEAACVAGETIAVGVVLDFFVAVAEPVEPAGIALVTAGAVEPAAPAGEVGFTVAGTLGSGVVTTPAGVETIGGVTVGARPLSKARVSSCSTCGLLRASLGRIREEDFAILSTPLPRYFS